MPLSVDQITTGIVNQLKSLDATVSAEVGTPERKIIEAVAEMIASTYVDFNVLDSQHDIDSMAGGRLDAYLGNFGFGRQRPTYATGTVTFSAASAPAADITIPLGTQVIARVGDNPDLVFTTTQAVVLHQTDNPPAVDAPIAASVPGSIGNVPANSIVTFSGFGSTVSGITAVTNAAATTGGADGEDDVAYRARFRNTLFRNMGGTYDHFLALALSADSVTKANVVGPISRFQEYVQVPATQDVAQQTILVSESEDTLGNPVFAITSTAGYDRTGSKFPHKHTTAVSTNPYSKFTYSQQAYLTDGGLGAAATFYKPGVDFVFNDHPLSAATGTSQALNNSAVADSQGFTKNADNHRPNVTFMNPYNASSNTTGDKTFTAGSTTVLMEHAYISRSSRNDFFKGILNCVDIFVNGQKEKSATSNEVIPTAFSNFSTDVNDIDLFTYAPNYARKLDGSQPWGGPAQSGFLSRLLPLYWQPVLDVPDSFKISDGVNTYTYYKAKFKPAKFKNSTAYVLNDVVVPRSADNGYSFKVTVAGTSGGSEPSWNTGSNTTSGGVTFAPVAGAYYSDAAFTKPAHYAMVEEISGYYGTIRARNGLEMFFLVGGVSSNGTYTGGKELRQMVGDSFTIKNYTFDQNISDLQAIVEKQKPVTSDALVHRARYRYFRPYVTIMYTPGSTKTVVDAAIANALASFFANHFYGEAIQLSDILQAVHNVPGVDNVRWTNEDPTTGNKVEETFANGDLIGASGKFYKRDFFIQDNQLAASPSTTPVTIVVRAQNTWLDA